MRRGDGLQHPQGGSQRHWLPIWDGEARATLADLDDAGPWQSLREICDGDRIGTLAAGIAEPTDEELLFVARRFITSSQEDTDMADVFPGSWSGSVVSSDGRELWFSVLISGYSWSGVDYDLIGPLATRDELESARLAKGFLNPDEVLPADLALMRAPRVG